MNKYLDYLMRRPFLEGEWRRAHLDLGIHCDSSDYDEFEMVLLQYRGKGRFYHGLAHLYYGLATIDEIASHLPKREIASHLPKRERALLKMAFFYHDVVYGMDNKAPNTNEMLSANQASQYLEGKLPAVDIERIRELILATADHQNSTCTDPLWPFMNDADLAILAAPPRVYRKYAKNVWKEYSVKYTRAQFVGGRVVFLRGLMASGKSIFMSPKMDHERQQVDAQVNIEDEFNRLLAEAKVIAASAS